MALPPLAILLSSLGLSATLATLAGALGSTIRAAAEAS